MSDVTYRKNYDEIIDRERAAGVMFGPFHQHWLLERAPEKVRKNLERARRHPDFFAMARQGFASMDINDVNTAAFNARNTSASELNMIGVDVNGVCPQAVINQYMAIPANDARAGKIYQVEMGGVYGNTGTPTLLITPRWGSSTTVATNITLGAQPAAWTTITGTTAQPYYLKFTFVIRTAPPGATLGTGIGTGFGTFVIPATSGQVAADLGFGNTAATIDTTGQGTAGCGLTMNLTWSASSASNTSQCLWFLLRSLN